MPRQAGTQTPAEIEAALKAAYAKFQNLKEGKNADYIAALAKVDPNLFGIALVTPDGKVYAAGDIKTEVSIQSISKVFTMAQVIQEQGAIGRQADRRGLHRHALQLDRRGRVVRTVRRRRAEMNPLVNPGAITATSMVKGSTADEYGRRSWLPQ